MTKGSKQALLVGVLLLLAWLWWHRRKPAAAGAGPGPITTTPPAVVSSTPVGAPSNPPADAPSAAPDPGPVALTGTFTLPPEEPAWDPSTDPVIIDRTAAIQGAIAQQQAQPAEQGGYLTMYSGVPFAFADDTIQWIGWTGVPLWRDWLVSGGVPNVAQGDPAILQQLNDYIRANYRPDWRSLGSFQ